MQGEARVTGGAQPTLLRAGSLREVRMPGGASQEGKRGALLSPPQKELDNQVPIAYVLNWIKERRTGGTGALHRTLFLLSSTGSGKSTVFIAELFHMFFSAEAANGTARDIACTQPRILTTREMTERVLPWHSAEALKAAGRGTLEPLVLDRNIGFQTGAVSRKPVRGIIYMTVGVLMRQLTVMTDEEITQKYSFIVVDEAHERSMEVDNTLYLLRQFLLRQGNTSRCPFVVVMSATMNPYKMADYLLREHPPSARYRNIIDVAGYTEPITEHFLELTSADLVADTVARVLAIHEEDRAGLERPTRDILVFGAGEMELQRLRAGVEQGMRDIADRGNGARATFFRENVLLPVTLTRKQVQAADAEYRRVFAPREELGVARRVVFATNVAETGVTIETLGHVVDTGLYKSNEFNPLYGGSVLVTKPVTRFMYTQRRGRVGRVAPGDCYAMYTRTTMEALDEDRPPNMLISDITSGLLSHIVRQSDPTGEYMGQENAELFRSTVVGGGAKRRVTAAEAAGFQGRLAATPVDLARMDLLTPPPADLLQYGLERLYVLGLVTENSTPTVTGWLVSQMDKITVENARMVLAAFAWGACPLDLLTIAAMLETETPALENAQQEEMDRWARLSGGDGLLLRLWSFLHYQTQLEDYGTKKLGGADPGEPWLDDGVYVPNAAADARAEYEWELGRPEEDEIARVLGGRDKKAGRDKAGKKEDAAGKKESKAGKKEGKAGRDKAGKKEGKSGKPSKKANEPVEDAGVLYAEAAKKRDQYLDGLVRLGFNPLQNREQSLTMSEPLDDQELIGRFALLKQCVWEGYKLNLAEWDGERYQSRRGRVAVHGDFAGRFVLYTDLRYQRGMFRASGLIPLDGYVPVDPNFCFY